MCLSITSGNYAVFAEETPEVVEEFIENSLDSVEIASDIVEDDNYDEVTDEVIAEESGEIPDAIAENEEMQHISIELPTVAESASSPLDFILDPHNLMQYVFPEDDGGILEPEQNFYFHNTEGEYEHSHLSDTITINNSNGVPLLVYIKIQMTQVDKLLYVNDEVIDTIDEPAVCLTVIDENDNVFYINEEGVISFVRTLDESFSFRISGRCSTTDKWSQIAAVPKLTINWDLKPQIMQDVEHSENTGKEVTDMAGAGFGRDKNTFESDEEIVSDASTENEEIVESTKLNGSTDDAQNNDNVDILSIPENQEENMVIEDNEINIPAPVEEVVTTEDTGLEITSE